MSTSTQTTDTRKTLKIDKEDWQWLVDQRAISGKPHKVIVHELIGLYMAAIETLADYKRSSSEDETP